MILLIIVVSLLSLRGFVQPKKQEALLGFQFNEEMQKLDARIGAGTVIYQDEQWSSRFN